MTLDIFYKGPKSAKKYYVVLKEKEKERVDDGTLNVCNIDSYF